MKVVRIGQTRVVKIEKEKCLLNKVCEYPDRCDGCKGYTPHRYTVGCECPFDGLRTLYCSQCPLEGTEYCRLVNDRLVNWQKLLELTGTSSIGDAVKAAEREGIPLPLL